MASGPFKEFAGIVLAGGDRARSLRADADRCRRADKDRRRAAVLRRPRALRQPGQARPRTGAAEINAAGGILGRRSSSSTATTDASRQHRSERRARWSRRTACWPWSGRSPRNNRDAMMPMLRGLQGAVALCHELRGRRMQPLPVLVQHGAQPGTREAAALHEGEGRRRLLHVRRRPCLAAEDVRRGRDDDRQAGRQGRRQGVHAGASRSSRR